MNYKLIDKLTKSNRKKIIGINGKIENKEFYFIDL